MIRNSFKLLMILVITVGILSSCGDDTINPTNENPTISFTNNTGDAMTVKPAESFTVSISAAKNAAELNGVEISEDGAKLDISRIKFKGNDIGGNPILLTSTDRTSLAADITIVASSVVGAHTYEIKVIDVNNKYSNVTKNITVSDPQPPVLNYTGPDVVDGVLPGVTNQFKFTVLPGSGKLQSIEVKENGLPIDKARLSFDGTAFDANPYIFAAANQAGFTDKIIGIKMPTTPGTYEYTFIFKNEFGKSTEKKVSVKIGSPIEKSVVGALFNSAGPAGTGGFDLDDAVGTGSSSSLAEIKDLGIDASPASSNWIQKIEGVNNTTLKLIRPGTEVESTFLFSSIAYKEDISSTLWAKGTAINGASDKVQTGWIFLALKDGKYYAFEVSEIIKTSNDNSDHYMLNVKW